MEKDELSLSLSRSVFPFPLTKPYRSPERRSAGLETEDLFGPVNRIHRIRSFRRINDPSPIHIFADISFHCLSTIRPDAYRSRVSRTTFVSPIIVYTVTHEKRENAREKFQFQLLLLLVLLACETKKKTGNEDITWPESQEK